MSLSPWQNSGSITLAGDIPDVAPREPMVPEQIDNMLDIEVDMDGMDRCRAHLLDRNALDLYDHSVTGWARTVRLLRKQPRVTALLISSVAYIAAHTVLLRFHQLFPGGADMGDVFNELAIASVGAWIFNLLVVVLPRERTERAARKAIYQPLMHLAATANEMEHELATAGGITLGGPRIIGAGNQRKSLSLEQVTDVFAVIRREHPAPKYYRDPSGQTRQLAWWQWLDFYLAAVETSLKSVLPFFPLLPEELVSAISDATYSDWAESQRSLLQFGPMPLGDAGPALPVYEHIQALRQMWTAYEAAGGRF